jgi:hypothetical protein
MGDATKGLIRSSNMCNPRMHTNRRPCGKRREEPRMKRMTRTKIWNARTCSRPHRNRLAVAWFQNVRTAATNELYASQLFYPRYQCNPWFSLLDSCSVVRQPPDSWSANSESSPVRKTDARLPGRKIFRVARHEQTILGEGTGPDDRVRELQPILSPQHDGLLSYA